MPFFSIILAQEIRTETRQSGWMKKFTSFSRIIKRKLRNERKMLISHLKDVGNQWREGFGGASSMLYVCSTFVFPSSSRWNRIMVTLCVGIDLESITNLGWNNKLCFSIPRHVIIVLRRESWECWGRKILKYTLAYAYRKMEWQEEFPGRTIFCLFLLVYFA